MRQTIRRMGRWLHHRGPDAWGEYVTQNVALGHNRLAIIDIESGNQPMSSTDDSVAVVFNGEIYNFRKLWKELQQLGHKFTTDHSDTEVIVRGYQQWGTNVFARLDGMFAIAIWDDRKRQLWLARDRMGIKPLYFTSLPDGGLVFASEPKAIIKSGLVKPRFRAEGMVEYFLFRAPYQSGTLFNEIWKLSPGCFRSFDIDASLSCETSFRPAHFAETFANAYEALDAVESTLKDAVKSHLMSDVPLGSFLSGGVDSSLITAFAAEQSSLDAFTIGTESEFDETPFASTVARHLNVPFNHRLVSRKDFLDRFDDWMFVNDDPCSDPSALALMLLSQQARESGMKVMLAGEGADELFGGYNAYLRFGLFARMARLPGQSLIASLLLPWASGRNRDYLGRLKNLVYFGSGHLTDLALRENLFSPSLQEYNLHLSDLCIKLKPGFSAVRTAMAFDQQVRLSDDLLMRTDRATMFYGLEARVPFLDNYVVDCSRRLRDEDCLRLLRKSTKPLLKQMAEKHVPRSVLYRPKRGFDLPIAQWLRESFNDTLHEYVDERRIPGLNYDHCLTTLNGLISRTGPNREAVLWAWLVIEKWYRQWIEGEAEPRCPEFAKQTESYRVLSGLIV